MGAPQRGYYGKTMTEVVLEHQGNPRTSSTELGPGKIFSLFWKGHWGSGVCVVPSVDKGDGREIPLINRPLRAPPLMSALPCEVSCTNHNGYCLLELAKCFMYITSSILWKGYRGSESLGSQSC